MHEQSASHYCPIQLNDEVARHGGADGPAGPVPLATAFLLDPALARGHQEDRPPLRSRYTLALRVFHLLEKHGRFFWEDHLEQVADWEDTLIVDVGRHDRAETDVRAWAAWNSQVPGSVDDIDPITEEPCRPAEEGGALHTEIRLPEVARPLLGTEARLRLTVSRFD